jgi:hypothetical protein
LPHEIAAGFSAGTVPTNGICEKFSRNALIAEIVAVLQASTVILGSVFFRNSSMSDTRMEAISSLSRGP